MRLARAFAPPIALPLAAATIAMIGAAGAVVGAAAADTVELPAVRDNSIFESETGDLSSGAGPTLFAGRNGQGLIRRALLTFDFAGAIPAGATIDSVALRLTVTDASNDTPRTVTVHRVLADWGEGASLSMGGRGAPAEPGDATWLHTFYSSELWASPGGDFDVSILASTVVTLPGLYVWTGPDLTADAQRALDDPGTFFGWILRGGEVDPNSARGIASREAEEVATRPVLYVEYREGVPTRASSWAGVKWRFVRLEPED